MTTGKNTDESYWRRARALFDAATDLPQEERREYVEAACAGVPALRDEVLGWLEADGGEDHALRDAVARLAGSVSDEPVMDVGEAIGPYALDRELAHGGMGTVYLAHRADDDFQRSVAIKVIRGWADAEMLRRFRTERQILADLDHPNIARLIDGGATREGLPYIVMEYVDGQPLGQYCDNQALTVRDRVALVRTLCRAVHYAHERGVVHRDLKPANVLVTSDGVPKLIDFGIARLFDDSDINVVASTQTLPGRSRMTPEYASPEQALDQTATTTSDVYVLGLLLYEVLTGVRPHQSGADTLRPSDVITRAARAHETTRQHGGTTDASTDFAQACLARQATPEKLARFLAGDLDTIVLKAIETEPGRRYSSAASLGDDLQRYLDGEPVHARTVSVAYLVRRRLRQHRRVALVVAAAVVVGLLQTTYWWVRQTQQRTELESAVRLGRLVERVGLDLRVERGLPLHDTRPAKARVLTRVAEIEQQMASMSPSTQGPSLYAVGLGYLALGDNEAARSALHRAWEIGYQAPEVATSLGLVLGHLYGEAVREINAVANPSLREQRRTVVQASLRDPAVTFLKMGEADRDFAEYRASLIAFLEGDLDQAVTYAGAARARINWLHETFLLEGDVALERSVSALTTGDYPRARETMVAAADRYRQAVRLAGSDPVPYARLCALGAIQMGLNLDTGAGVEQAVADAIAHCRQASQADPDLAQPYVDLARTYWNLGTYLNRNGQDPTATLALAATSAREAITRDPAHAKAYMHLGTALQLQGAHEYDTGADPRVSLAAAVEAYGRASRLGLDDASLHNSLANTHAYLGDWQRQRGMDPRETLALAVAGYRKAGDREPANAVSLGNLGIAYKDLAMYEAGNGRDPLPLLQQSIEAYNEALRRNPNHAPTLNNAAQSWYRVALSQISGGADPTEALRQADALADRALEVNPNYATPYVNRAEIALARAGVLVTAGADPTDVLERGRVSLRRALQINPNNRSQFYAHSARVELADARWRIRQGQDAGSAIAAARRFAAQMRIVNPNEMDGWELAALADVADARARMREGLSPAAVLKFARVAIDHARRTYPDAPWYIETSLTLTVCRLDSRLDADAETMASLTAAQALANHALSIRPNHQRTIALGAVVASRLGELAKNPQQTAAAQKALAAALKANPNLAEEFAPYVHR